MPRTRQYYDPIIQAPSSVEGEQDLSRVEIYMDADLKWWGREVLPDGSLSGQAVSAFQHQDVISAANNRWPGLMVYELRNESDDSTWEGTGPSPRLWQSAFWQGVEDAQSSSPGDADGASREPPPTDPLPDSVGARPEPGDDIPPAGELHVLAVAATGAYVRLSDVLALLHIWADQYESEKNPSAALAVREVAQTLLVTEQ